MKACFSKRKLIAWLALGELDERQAQALRSHIQTCEGCRRYLEEFSAVRERLAAVDMSPSSEVSESFHREWVGRLKAERPISLRQVLAERLNWRVALPALGAAAVLAVIVLSLSPRQREVIPLARANHAVTASVRAAPDLSPSVGNYLRATVRSLDEFDDLLTAQANQRTLHAPIFTASVFAAAASQN
jgi:anti-sigma factor RsiW